MKKAVFVFTCVTFVIGFMIAVQFQSVGETASNGERNAVEIRQALLSQQERQQQLREDIRTQRELLAQYEDMENIEGTMTEILTALEEEAGLTEVSGPGVVVTVDIALSLDYDGGGISTVPAYLLRMLLNDINTIGAAHISVGAERLVSTTAIREANGRTLVNGKWLPYFPLEIHVITDNPEALHFALMSAESRELFLLENLTFHSEPVEELTVPAFDSSHRVRYMETVEEEL
ncbi:DUF881 domain-containing protein [Paenalkalicoccus suaedae]|uniref:DUF881 domain-containing protein n=1 Tax=Paenalkalicoccus suaedae TaxID=2592382 RepID=A0A859FF85_9BACI|nr:DUF881 domain-containing protein [Paenalkalicoccus suaedae]QKS71520.1 DUF881 domain-containing protein [Paenalkalicoccus suaedae]